MTESTKSGIKGISYVIFYAEDMEASCTWYRDTLGLTPKMESPDWTEYETGATTLAIHPRHGDAEAPPAGGCMDVVFEVDDVVAMHAELAERGVEFKCTPRSVCEMGPDAEGHAAEFTDPDGNLMSIFGIVEKSS